MRNGQCTPSRSRDLQCDWVKRSTGPGGKVEGTRTALYSVFSPGLGIKAKSSGHCTRSTLYPHLTQKQVP